MVDIDQCHMEAVDPRTVWIMLMGYEVDENILRMYVENLLNSPLDPNKEIFGTYAKKSLQVHLELRKPVSIRRVRKETKILAEEMGLLVEKLKEIRRQRDEAEATNEKEKETTFGLGTSTLNTRTTRSSPATQQNKVEASKRRKKNRR